MSYKSEYELGRGGFGVVEVVVDEKGNRFARKRFQPSAAIPAAAYVNLRKRFKREVKFQQQLGGLEILPILDAELDGDEPWFLMPLAEKTYETQIREDKQSGKVTVDALADILTGLQHLHDFGFVHRDLNPNNILLHEGKWKLADLGALLPPTGQTVTLTEDTVIYTELYCSPEQRKDFHAAQATSDVYSFGCILHDIFGVPPRRPYSQHSTTGPLGLVIEKCTEIKPERRPKVSVLRPLLLDALADAEGVCTVDDKEAESWLARIESVESWTEEDFEAFVRFFAQLDLGERVKGHENEWVESSSTPFMSRIPHEAILKIAARQDGASCAIIDKYCEWAMTTSFAFNYSDTIAVRLDAICKSGSTVDKARSVIALIRLGFSHHRFYVMRSMLRNCGKKLSKDEAKRIYFEIKTEELEDQFAFCANTVDWNRDELHESIAPLFDGK